MTELPLPPAAAGKVLDAKLDLLDRQTLDRAEVPVTTIDDLELTDPTDLAALDPNAPPRITAILTGPVILTRIFGGRPPDSRYIRIPWSLVTAIDVVITLGVDAETLDATWVSRWMRDHIIARIPGGRHDPE
jgi:hypothetical protein